MASERDGRPVRRICRSARRPGRWRIAVLLGALPAVVSCEPDRPPAEWESAAGYRSIGLEIDIRGGAGFRRIPAGRTGVDAVDDIPLADRIANRTLVQGAGVALGDADGDGLVDIYQCRLAGPNVLYRNLGDWRFEDVTEPSGAGLPGRSSRGAAFADVDGDADLDLIVTVHGARNALLLNDGAGRFQESPDAGLEGEFGSSTAALADVDQDGDLDLYVANYKTTVGDDLFSPAERSFDRISERVGDSARVRPEFAEHYRVARVGDVVRRWELADPDEFYLNDGAGRFSSVSLTSNRFLDEEGGVRDAADRDWGLVARFHDMDGDGDPDLYVANDFGSQDHIWVNQGGGMFREAGWRAIRTTSGSSMAVDFSDIERDGDTDIFTSDMLSRDPVRRRSQANESVSEPMSPGEMTTRTPASRNALQLNRGDGTFAEISQHAGIDATEFTWGALFLDVDLDGYEDLLITTGHAWDPLHADTQEGLASGRIVVDWRAELTMFPELPVENLSFRNGGGWRFEETDWGFSDDADVSHGIASADLDGDGDLDVAVTRLDEPVALYRNESAAARVAVRLIGRAPNTAAIGAVVRVEGGPVPQSREVSAGGMYLSGSDPLQSFAAGRAEELTIRVRWPTGRESVVLDARPNRLYEIPEPLADAPSARPPADAASGARVAAEDPDAGDALFVDATDELAHTHIETPFDEFRRQPLLPLRLSQPGPGVSWEDIDRDGDPDLLLGAGAGGRLSIYRNEAGRLVREPREGPVTELDLTTILAHPTRSGAVELLVGQSNYETRTLEEVRAAAAVLRVDPARPDDPPAAAIEGALSATGPLAMADVEGDGDLDLFVGGRVVPGLYPAEAGSRLFLDDEGDWVEDGQATAVLAGIGLVSGAVFSDVNGDGWPDLLLALEWGPPRLWLNRDGRLEEATAAWGLDGLTGRWNGIATGDLNGDGRPDAVLTGWGDNTAWRPTPDRPIRVYSADFDGNGTFDVVPAREDPALRGDAPIYSLRRLSAGMPFIRRITPTHEEFASATVADLLAGRLDRARIAEAGTFAHQLLINRGDGFDARPLPAVAQLAPAFHAGIADFNGDGHEDLFLAQNFFATDFETTKHDAGRSLLLLGDGAGDLGPLTAEASGIAVYGEARGAAAADVDGDGRLDLAVGQNGAATRFFRNRGARPALRVRLVGAALNPDAVGASIRVVYSDGRGPVREVQAGSGYWSRNGAVQLLGLRDPPIAVWVRWPGGDETTAELAPGAMEVTITRREGDG